MLPMLFMHFGSINFAMYISKQQNLSLLTEHLSKKIKLPSPYSFVSKMG